MVSVLEELSLLQRQAKWIFLVIILLSQRRTGITYYIIRNFMARGRMYLF